MVPVLLHRTDTTPEGQEVKQAWQRLSQDMYTTPVTDTSKGPVACNCIFQHIPGAVFFSTRPHAGYLYALVARKVRLEGHSTNVTPLLFSLGDGVGQSDQVLCLEEAHVVDHPALE